MKINFEVERRDEELFRVRTTGYYPPPATGYKTEKEAAMEGGGLDCKGQKLRTLQDYQRDYTGTNKEFLAGNSSTVKSYVSCAVDKRRIPLGTIFTLAGIYDADGELVVCLACDVGSMILDNHIDICVDDRREANKVTTKGEDRSIKIIGFLKKWW